MAKERVTLVLPPELWQRVKRIARQRGTSASALVAEALERLLSSLDTEARLAAVRRIAAHNLPVAPPDELEKQIARGALEQAS